MLTPREPTRYSIYGLPVEISCDVGGLDDELARLLGAFRVREFSGAAQTTTGIIRPFDEADVLRHLSPGARRIVSGSASAELYEEGERFWLIDDRWGMVEVNLLKSHWRAWLLPEPRVDSVRRAEMALLWPMAQLLRARGLYLLPAASVVRNGLGMLLLSPFGLAAELSVLVRAGCRVVGQRWTALRERDGRVEMLHLPGLIERPLSPRNRATSAEPWHNWVDLMAAHCGAELASASCTGVFVIAHGRRPTARLHELKADAIDVLRASWPIEELHPLRRRGQLANRLATRCACYEVALSRDPHDLLGLLNTLPQRGMGLGMTLPIRQPQRGQFAIAV